MVVEVVGLEDFMVQLTNILTLSMPQPNSLELRCSSFYFKILLQMGYDTLILQEAISYSDGAATVSSAIPAFAKKGDLLLVDEAVSEPILTGLNLSRSTVQFFKHNDMNHLRTIMESIAYDDKRLKRDTLQQRRFIIVEGLYRNTGDVCPLPEILRLKEEFFYRLILDESLSFGTMGRTGRGITEHYQIQPTDVEIILVAMDTALASVGGVCVGNREIVDHQRLSGAGYCFSASAPPFLSAAAIKALTKLESEPQLLEKLHNNARYLHSSLSKHLDGLLTLRYAQKEIVTPVLHLCLTTPLVTVDAEATLMMRIAHECIVRGVAVLASKFSLVKGDTNFRPTLTLNASTKLTTDEMDKIVAVLKSATIACL